MESQVFQKLEAATDMVRTADQRQKAQEEHIQKLAETVAKQDEKLTQLDALEAKAVGTVWKVATANQREDESPRPARRLGGLSDDQDAEVTTSRKLMHKVKNATSLEDLSVSQGRGEVIASYITPEAIGRGK